MAIKKVILNPIVDGEATNDELYPRTSVDQVVDLEDRLNSAGRVNTVSVNGGTPIEPDENKNVDLTLSGGDNTADEEDLTSVETATATVLKFKDKAYAPAAFSGLGRKYLRKNIVEEASIEKVVITDNDINFGKYINTNQGTGNVCPMTVESYEQFGYYTQVTYAGDVWTIQAHGGGTPRLWALINHNDNNKVISAAASQENSIDEPLTINIEQECTMVINLYVAQFHAISVLSNTGVTEEYNKLTSEMMPDGNTIYHIMYDYDLNNSNLVLPARSVLKFEGGTIKNGTITGSMTTIDAPGYVQIFNLGTDITGTWTNNEWYPEWFGAAGDKVTDDTAYIQKILDLPMASNGSPKRGITCVLNNKYRTTDTLLIKGAAHLKGANITFLNSGSSDNGTIYADFGTTDEEMLKWIISTYNVNKSTGVLMKYNSAHSHVVNLTFISTGIIIEGLNITAANPVYGGIRMCGVTDGRITNCSISKVYVGIMRGGNWYSSDSNLNILAYMCGYSSVAENNGLQISDAYINKATTERGLPHFHWRKITLENEVTVTQDSTSVVLPAETVIECSSQNKAYYTDDNDVEHLVTFPVGDYAGTLVEDETPVFYQVFTSGNSTIGVIRWRNDDAISGSDILKKYYFDDTVTGSLVPKKSTSAGNITGGVSYGYYQSYGSAVFNNVVSEIWDIARGVASGMLVENGAYLEAISGALYNGYYSKIVINGTVNGDYSNIDNSNNFAYHIIADYYSKFTIIGNDWKRLKTPDNTSLLNFITTSKDAAVNSKSCMYESNVTSGPITLNDAASNIMLLSRTPKNGFEDPNIEKLSIESNTTVTLDGAMLRYNKSVSGGNKSSSVLSATTTSNLHDPTIKFYNMTISLSTNFLKTWEYYDSKSHCGVLYFKECILELGSNYLLVCNQYLGRVRIIFDGCTIHSTTGKFINASTDGNKGTILLDVRSTTFTNPSTSESYNIYSCINGSNCNLIPERELTRGATTKRPALGTSVAGFRYYDTTIGREVIWNGTEWEDPIGDINAMLA